MSQNALLSFWAKQAQLKHRENFNTKHHLKNTKDQEHQIQEKKRKASFVNNSTECPSTNSERQTIEIEPEVNDFFMNIQEVDNETVDLEADNVQHKQSRQICSTANTFASLEESIVDQNTSQSDDDSSDSDEDEYPEPEANTFAPSFQSTKAVQKGAYT